MRTYKYLTLILTIVLMLILSACRTTEIIIVRITPTPNMTEVPLQTEEVLPTVPPTVALTPTSAPTDAPSPTHTPSEPPTIAPTADTFIGSIVGEDYQSPTPPPTQTPLPTQTPMPITPTATLEPPPRLDGSRMGIQVYSHVEFQDWGDVIGLVEDTGVKWVKVQVNWDFLQPEGSRVFGVNLQIFERQMEALKRHGFNILLSIAKAPSWARSNLTESGPPDNPEDLADFIRFILHDTKIGPVTDAIEIWNEPNLIREWQGVHPFNGAGYMRLFEPAYRAIREYSPHIVIVTAGLAPTGNTANTVDDRDYLQQMYNNGLRNYQDVVIGVHPYGWGNPPDARCCASEGRRGWDDSSHFFFLDNLEAMYNITQRNGDLLRQLWVTEFGWSTWDGFSGAPPETWITFNTLNDQARYNIRAFEIGQNLPYVGVMFLWNLNYANDILIEQRSEIAGYSLIIPQTPRERPAYWLLGQATGKIQP